MGKASRRKKQRIRLEDDRTLPPALRDPFRLAFVAAMLSWREGDPVPPMPKGVTAENLPSLLEPLEDPKVRLAVVRWLSKLTPKSAAVSHAGSHATPEQAVTSGLEPSKEGAE